MEIYWNVIALPLFMIVLLFGLFILFRMSGAQRATTSSVLAAVAALRKGPQALNPVRPPVAAATAAAAPGRTR